MKKHSNYFEEETDIFDNFEIHVIKNVLKRNHKNGQMKNKTRKQKRGKEHEIY